MYYKYKKNYEKSIERWKIFWERKKPIDRIPIIIRCPFNYTKKWEECCLNPSCYLNYWEAKFKQRLPLIDDYIPAFSTNLKVGLIGAILGCKLEFSQGTSWSSHPIINRWDQLDYLKFSTQNKWYLYLKKLTEFMVEKSRGQIDVGIANLLGPGDIMSTLRGTSNLCLDFFDNPSKVHELAIFSIESWKKVMEMQLNTILHVTGGTVDDYMYWTPGNGVRFTEDVSVAISPKTYQDFFFPYDQMIINCMDFVWLHLHSGSIHLVEEFIKLENLKGIQLINDNPNLIKLNKLIPCMQKIQKSNLCLILRKFTWKEINEILPNLSGRGLLIDLNNDYDLCGSIEEAQDLLQIWDKVYLSLVKDE